MTIEDNELMEIEKGENDEDVLPEDNSSPAFDPRKIDITAEQNTLSAIIAMIEDGAIDLNPEFQRKGDLWPEITMSRLIESVLLQIPIPAFYFDASESSNDDKWLVVDGLQRLSTFKRFMMDKGMVLKGLTLLKDLNGKKFEELDKNLQRRMERYQIITYLIKPNTPKIVRYDLFRRINTGGLVLTPQEIRHALNPKPAKYLKELSENKSFKDIVRVDDKRMADRELILRYLAFSMKSYKQYKPPLNVFLDSAMESLGELDDKKLDELRQNLRKALITCKYLFGEHIFSKSISGSGNKRLNTSLFEVWTVLIGELNDTNIERLKKEESNLIKEFKEALDESWSFTESISNRTSNKDAVIKRFETIELLINKYKV